MGDELMQQGQARVAVIGAGPSGLYAAAALLASGEPVSVEVLDRLPAPYGLVRYGVAPDHVKMKSVIRVLQKPFDPAHVEFLGGIRVGDGGIPLDVVREHFHAVVHATGSSVDRHLGVPGEDLAGSLGSGAFVSWYCGHPDRVELQPVLDRPGVAVVGAGNVALDVARVLAKTADEMAETDVPEPVLSALRDSAVRDVHVLIRRGPQHVRFTPAELRRDRRAPQRRRGRPRRRAARRRRRGSRGQAPAAEPGHAPGVGRSREHRQAAADPSAVPAQPGALARCGRPGECRRGGAQQDRRRRPGGLHRRGGDPRRRARGARHRLRRGADRGSPVRCPHRHGAEQRWPCDARRRARAWRVRHGVDQAWPDGCDRHEQSRCGRDGRGAPGRPARAPRARTPRAGDVPGGTGVLRDAPGRLDGLVAPGRGGGPPRWSARRGARQGRRPRRHARGRARGRARPDRS